MQVEQSLDVRVVAFVKIVRYIIMEVVMKLISVVRITHNVDMFIFMHFV